MENNMNAGTILKQFYDAVQERDMAKARTYLADDMTFVGLFETYPNADAYIATFTQLMQIVTRLNVKTIIAEGDNAAIFVEMVTTAPAPATTLVAEWHQTRNGKITRAQSAFDGRPFAAMFAGPQAPAADERAHLNMPAGA
jgi:ketosteroid isomerase-like protein